MGWIEDSLDEFRKLPPAGKVAVGAAGVGVAILAYAQYRSRASSAASASAGGANGGLSTLSGGLGSWGSNAPTSSGVSVGDTSAPLAPPNPFAALRQAGVGIITSRPPTVAPGPSGGAHLSAPTIWTNRAGQTITISAGGAVQ